MSIAAPLSPPRPAAPPAARSGTARRLLAAAVIAQPLLIGVNATFHPEVEMTAAGLLAGAAADPTRWYLVHLIAAVGAALGAVAAVGLRTLITDRGRRAGNVAVGAAALGAVVLAITFGAEASLFRSVTVAGVDPAAALAVADVYASAPEFFAIPVGVLASTLGGLLMGAALIAARSVPRWAAVTFLGGSVVTLAAVPGTPVGPIAFGIVAVASAVLARYVARGGAA
jgi:hypothetical protein